MDLFAPSLCRIGEYFHFWVISIECFYFIASKSAARNNYPSSLFQAVKNNIDMGLKVPVYI